MSAAALVVFARAPQPGRVKTRLCPPLTPEQAAGLYAAMLVDVLAATAEHARALELRAAVAVHPWERRGDVIALAPPSLRLVPQRGANLAARMTWAVREAAAAGARRILLRGSDSPTLAAADLGAALSALADHELVLRPDRDGGYGLVGLRAPGPHLFDHPMGARTVLEDTRANAERLGWRTALMPPGFDVDTAADLHHLAAVRAAGGAGGCPRTLAYLDAGSLWPEGAAG